MERNDYLIRKKFYGKKLMEVASMIPFAIPGIALGIGYILAFNTKPILLTGTAAIVVAALTFRTLSVGVEAGSNSLRAVDPSIEEASAVLGANSFITFFTYVSDGRRHSKHRYSQARPIDSSGICFTFLSWILRTKS